ncbi:MAG: hypothetical protein RLZZ584_2941 [Pseudomonadota bacterium]
MVHQRDVGGVVQRGTFHQQAGLRQQAFGVLVAFLGQEDLVGLLVGGEVARLDHAFAGARVGLADLLLQEGHDGVDAHVQLGVVLGLAADDERRARLVDQDGIDLVDDGVVQAALHAVGQFVDHVVAQVVETELVVRAVGDVRGVGGLLLLAAHLRQVDAHRHAQEVVQRGHPLGIASGEVVVHRHHMHALARQRVQEDGQRGHERLAFAGAHLGDLAVVQHHAADQLHVEVAHLQGALAALAHDGKGFGEDVIQCDALGNALAQALHGATQLVVAQLLVLGFERGDVLDHTTVLLEQAVVATAENLGEELGQHGQTRSWARLPAGWPSASRSCRGGCRSGICKSASPAIPQRQGPQSQEHKL